MATLTKIKTITGHRGLALFYMEHIGNEDPVGYIPTQIRQPFRYSPTHAVVLMDGKTRVVIVETAHRKAEVHRVDGDIFTTEEAAMKAAGLAVRS